MLILCAKIVILFKLPKKNYQKKIISIWFLSQIGRILVVNDQWNGLIIMKDIMARVE